MIKKMNNWNNRGLLSCGSIKKAINVTVKNNVKIFALPSLSDSADHPNRPNPLNKPMIPTIVAAAAADIPTCSCAIGDAADMSIIPQVTLMKNMTHSIQKRLEASALLGVKSTVAPCALLGLDLLVIGGRARYRAPAIIRAK